MEENSSLIPRGMYCYTVVSFETNSKVGRLNIIPCPHWSRREDKPEQESGYCSYLKKGDWEPPLGLLWDMCKECWVNVDED